MSYVDSSLAPDERVIYRWSIHNFYNVMLVIWAWVGLLLMSAFSGGSTGNSPFAIIAFVWLILMVRAIYGIIYNMTTEIAVTNKRIVYKTGIIARNVFELQLSKIESASLDQTILQRIIGAGALRVSWTGWHSRPIGYLASPNSMRSVVYEQIEKLRS